MVASGIFPHFFLKIENNLWFKGVRKKLGFQKPKELIRRILI